MYVCNGCEEENFGNPYTFTECKHRFCRLCFNKVISKQMKTYPLKIPNNNNNNNNIQVFLCPFNICKSKYRTE